MTTRILLVLPLALTACRQALPAGFWKQYTPDLLVANRSNQGPYGGYRSLYWKARTPHTFTSSALLGFAADNGWTLADSMTLSQQQTRRWTYGSQPVFPLTSAGFTRLLCNDPSVRRFPRWFDGPCRLYRFKTGWRLIDPGTDTGTRENGFIVLDTAGTQLAVYHLWGE